MERSLRAGVLASLLVGAAFVPLNRRYPPERTLDMLVQADVDALIVDADALPLLLVIAHRLPRAPILLLPSVLAADVRDRWFGPVAGPDTLRAAPRVTSLPALCPDDPAYLMFTSGSSGKPKGVLITQGNIRAFLNTNAARYRLTPDDRLSQTFELTFDLSLFDMFMAWDAGAALCPLQPIELLAPARALDRLGITVWFSVPSVANLLLDRGALPPGCFPSLRYSLFCGEALPQATAAAWQAAAPNAVLENLYGPTELTVACAAYRWDPRKSPAECINALVPIGEIYPDLPYRILNEALHDAETGELCVAGAQTSPGYWRAPEITADRFIVLPGAGGEPHRYYRTGDLVTRHGDNLIFLGRGDGQLKISGYRVELGEIEGFLLMAGCTQAAVLPWPDARHPTGVVAVVPAPADIAYLLDYLGQRLPAHMLPRTIQAIEGLPLNANGKVDRGALRDWLVRHVGVDGVTKPAYAAPGEGSL